MGIVGELITFEASDGLLLSGFYVSAPTNKETVIHIHGNGGSFFSAEYNNRLAQAYADCGYNYLIINTRGAGYITKFRHVTKGKLLIGHSFEIFEECIYDIEGAISFIRNAGCGRFILQGHSTGAQKAVYAAYRLKPVGLQQLVLLSPCDDWGLAIRHYGQDHINTVSAIAANLGDAFIDPTMFFGKIISGNSFLSFYGPHSPFNIFHYHQPSLPFVELSEIRAPIVSVFGDGDLVETFSTITQVMDNLGIGLVILPNTKHDYAKSSDLLAKIITDRLTNGD